MANVETAPMTLAEALAYLKPDPANNGTISLRAPKARESVEVIESALLRARALPDPVPGYMRPPNRGWVLYGASFEHGRMTVPGLWLPPGHPLLSKGTNHGQ